MTYVVFHVLGYCWESLVGRAPLSRSPCYKVCLHQSDKQSPQGVTKTVYNKFHTNIILYLWFLKGGCWDALSHTVIWMLMTHLVLLENPDIARLQATHFKSVFSTSPCKHSESNAELGQLYWPNTSTLTTRLRRLITAYQRSYKRQQMRQEALMKTDRRRRRPREEVRALEAEREAIISEKRQKWVPPGFPSTPGMSPLLHSYGPSRHKNRFRDGDSQRKAHCTQAACCSAWRASGC